MRSLSSILPSALFFSVLLLARDLSADGGRGYAWSADDTVPDGESKTVQITRGSNVDLWERAGWKCFARVLTTEPTATKRRLDKATIRCSNGSIAVRSETEQVEGADPVPPALLMVGTDPGDKPVRLIFLTPKLVSR